ncbi:MAG TPA: hypothetical protein VKE70_25565 [Candidatus Solibacter sp.]|nr:hypothetical protein [Candidatus Solibacter sp.]
MNALRMIAFLSLGQLIWAAEGDGPAKLPPVLKGSEGYDSVIVTLPGARSRPAPVPTPEPVAPPAAPAPELVAAIPPKSPPELNRKAFFPPDLQKEVALFCQKLIGQWAVEDAELIFGKASRSRPSFDEKKAVNGRIYSFPDPTGRYRELELDFDQSSGTLRTVFAYPKQMTWQECRKRWNGEVSEADAKQGRTFYSYLNRRLDVLVDARGKVISLGLY